MSQQTMTTNGYFGPGLFRFLKDLKTHNERGWFQANKQRYKADVQAPFLRLITDLAPVQSRSQPYETHRQSENDAGKDSHADRLAATRNSLIKPYIAVFSLL
jgi:uncharacterized protein (DUF2461 family)